MRRPTRRAKQADAVVLLTGKPNGEKSESSRGGNLVSIVNVFLSQASHACSGRMHYLCIVGQTEPNIHDDGDACRDFFLFLSLPNLAICLNEAPEAVPRGLLLQHTPTLQKNTSEHAWKKWWRGICNPLLSDRSPPPPPTLHSKQPPPPPPTFAPPLGKAKPFVGGEDSATPLPSAVFHTPSLRFA